MNGFVLNEKGNVTYPYKILKYIEPYVKSLKWKVNCIEHNGETDKFTFPFDEQKDYLLDGEQLFSLLKDNSNVQWIWGMLSGFPSELSWEGIKGSSNGHDITTTLPYSKDALRHIENNAVFELIALDSSETYVLIDEESVVSSLLRHFPDAAPMLKEDSNAVLETMYLTSNPYNSSHLNKSISQLNND